MAYNLLKGKRGIIFGALNNMSIAWKVAERCAEEGAKIVLSNTEMALRMGELDELSKKIDAPIIAADATNYDDLENVFVITGITLTLLLELLCQCHQNFTASQLDELIENSRLMTQRVSLDVNSSQDQFF